MKPPKSFVLGITGLAASAAGTGSAQACSIAIHVLAIEADPLDVAPPSGISDLVVDDLTRGVSPSCDPEGICSASSCDDLGGVTVRFTLPKDDRTHTFEHGYVTWIEEGQAPDYDGALELTEPRMATALSGGQGWLHIPWVDGATDAQEAFDVVLAIAPVDASGKEGPASYVRVVDTEPTAPIGCAHVLSTPTALLGLAAPAFFFVARRRT